MDDEAMNNSDDVPNHSPDPDVFEGKRVHRSIIGEEVKEEAVEKKIKEYIPGTKKFTRFFSKSSPYDLLNSLTCFAISLTNDFEIESSEYAMRMTVIENEEALSMRVSILKVPGQDKYCVEATQEEGNRMYFNKMFKNMKGYFGGHVNATYST